MTMSSASGVAASRATETNVVAETAAGKDERPRARIAGLALIASPIVWWLTAVVLFPTLGGFYARGDDPLTKLNALASQQAAWTVQSLVFFGGTLAAVVGLGLLASLLWHTRAAALARAGAIGSLAIAGVSVFTVLLRVTTSVDAVRTEADVPTLMMAAHFGWFQIASACLVAATVAIHAAALFWSGRAKVTGALVAALSGLALVALLARTGGPPAPLIVYPLAALLGVRLLFWGAAPSTSDGRAG